MEVQTRKKFIEEKIDDFLKSPNESSIKIRMYSSEIRKFNKIYPNINVQADTKVYSALRHPMVLCTVTKK